MSRTQIKKSLTVESLEEAMAGKAWTQNGTALLDEHPKAYKPIETVMADQADLVEIQATLHQIARFSAARGSPSDGAGGGPRPPPHNGIAGPAPEPGSAVPPPPGP